MQRPTVRVGQARRRSPLLDPGRAMKSKTTLLLSVLVGCGVMTLQSGFAVSGDAVDRDDNAKSGKAASLTSCCTAGDDDFPKVGGNLGNQNYSSLAQINKGNIRLLGAAWLNNIEGGPGGDRKSTRLNSSHSSRSYA